MRGRLALVETSRDLRQRQRKRGESAVAEGAQQRPPKFVGDLVYAVRLRYGRARHHQSNSGSSTMPLKTCRVSFFENGARTVEMIYNRRKNGDTMVWCIRENENEKNGKQVFRCSLSRDGGVENTTANGHQSRTTACGTARERISCI